MADVNVKINVDASQGIQSTESLKSKMKQLKDQMGAILVETDGLTKASAEQRAEYNRLEQEMGRLTDIQGDMAARVKTLANDNMKLSATMQGASGLIAGFGALQSAIALCGGENKQLLAVMQKVQAAQALLNSVNTIAQTLNKDSALRVALRVAKEKLLTKELEGQTRAQLALNAAKKASLGIIGLVAAGVTALAIAFANSNEEEQKGNDILEKRKTILDEIKEKHSQIVRDIMEENKQLKDLLKYSGDLDKGSMEYADAISKLSKQTGLDAKYLQTLTQEEQADLQGLWEKYTLYDQKVKDIEASQKEEGADWARLEQERLNWKKLQLKYERLTNDERRKQFEWEKKQNDASNKNSKGNGKPKAVQDVEDLDEALDGALDKIITRNKELNEAHKQYDELRKKGLEGIADDLVSTGELFDEYIALADAASEEQANKLEEDAKNERQILEQKLENRKAYWNAATLLQKSFSNLVSELQQQELDDAEGNEKKQLAIRKKYAKANFLSQIAEIGISTAEAIMGAWSSVSTITFPGNLIAGGTLTAMLAATGMTQAVRAKNEMDKALSGKAAKGAFITGKSHAQGGELWELEGGEAVLNKNAMAIPQYRALASYMNASTGGVSFMKGNNPMSALIDKSAIREIVSEIVSIPVVVSERAITDTQRKVQVINNRSTY